MFCGHARHFDASPDADNTGLWAMPAYNPKSVSTKFSLLLVKIGCNNVTENPYITYTRVYARAHYIFSLFYSQLEQVCYNVTTVL